jgi:hypothetical protein
MYSFKRSLVALFGLLLLIGAVSAVTPFTGYGQQSPDAVAATQNVFVTNPSNNPVQTKIVNGSAAPVPIRDLDAARAGNHIMLSCPDGNGIFRRVTSTGFMGTNEFVVPAGQVLMVMDVQWLANCFSCTSRVNASLILFIGSEPGVGNIVSYTNLPLEGNEYKSANENMKAGIAVAAGRRIRFENGQYVDRAILRGYLVPAS